MLALLIVAATLSSSTSAADTSRPNIVFIMADDLGWADVAFHQGNTPTPNLDRLAREGVELARHYVAPVCSPTRTGLMTGRCWSRFGVTSPQNERALPWNTLTLPRALKQQGYDTCLTGKWHLGSKTDQGPNHFGFDHSYGSLAGGVGPWNHFYKQGPFSVTWQRNEKLIEETGHVTDLIAREAVQWIEGRGERPFFLYVPFTAVHLPIKEPDEYLRRVPESIQGETPRQYSACVMHLDDAVGRIVAALEKTGRRENTLVVFTSDNGGSTSENNDTKYPADSYPAGKLTGNNTPWRGQKGQVYEGGIRVPAVINWPGKLKPGKVESPVQITDWMPTFCSLADYKANFDPKWDGTNIWPIIQGDALKDEFPRSIYTVSPGWRSRSLHVGNWKLVVHGEGAKQEVELYDLAKDPAESLDVSKRDPERVKGMLAKLDEVAARDKDSLAKDDPPAGQ